MARKKRSAKNADGLRGGFEPQVEKILKGMQREYGFDIGYEKLSYTVSIPTTYVPDFKLQWPDGSFKVLECKGYFDYADQRKVLAFRDSYPDVDYHIVFERNNPIRKNAKMRYLDWAKKNGIKAAVGEVPKEWFEDTMERPGDYLE